MNRDEESREILNRVKRESETMLGSSLQRAADHFSGRDKGGAEPDDAVEKWGRIAGRALAVIIALICLYVLLT